MQKPPKLRTHTNNADTGADLKVERRDSMAKKNKAEKKFDTDHSVFV
jgi:hypothetical protein